MAPPASDRAKNLACWNSRRRQCRHRLGVEPNGLSRVLPAEFLDALSAVGLAVPFVLFSAVVYFSGVQQEQRHRCGLGLRRSSYNDRIGGVQCFALQFAFPAIQRGA